MQARNYISKAMPDLMHAEKMFRQRKWSGCVKSTEYLINGLLAAEKFIIPDARVMLDQIPIPKSHSELMEAHLPFPAVALEAY
ncbi:MAG: hypothetical protein ACWGQW_24820, partial [bacterium]